jgi:hypothetical protein
MPTAVERLLDSFLKLTGVDDRGALDEATLKIDDAFLTLSTASTDTFHKIENLGFIKFSFEKLGDSFIKLSDDFHKITVAEDAFGDAVLKLTGNPNGDAVGGLRTDFAMLDHKLSATSDDLKILGTDFLKLDTAPNFADFQQKWNALGGDFHKFSGDIAAAVDAFHKVSEDFLKLSQGGDRPSPVDLAYKELGGELQSVGDTLGLVAGDFLKIGDAVAATGGAGAGRPGDATSATGGAGAGTPDPIGAALQLLFQHFHDLDVKLNALGDGSVRVLDSLEQPALFADTSSRGSGHG